MPVINISSDYTNRTKDISVFQYPEASLVEAQEVLPKFGNNARFCTGTQKILQKYAIILLTNISSQPNYPNFGTDLLSTLQGGISSVDRVLAAQIFTLASFAAVTELRRYQTANPDLPEDETIVRAELLDLTLYGGYVGFSVKIVTAAGDNINFIVPLPK
jgi:hypothetical protein